MEADLARHYSIDWRDRWRLDEHGRPRLTLRRLWVLLQHLPSESALGSIDRNGHPEWRLEHVLLAHVWQQTARSKKPHPMLTAAMKRNQRRVQDPARVQAARRRAAERRRAIAAGEIT